MKPILFNAEMVRAILDRRKTVTRRVVKPQPTEHLTCGPNWKELLAAAAAPYHPGDVLWVRETWAKNAYGGFFYKADGKCEVFSWRPSIHMPREAARLFLRVTDVRVEKAWDITDEQATKEGCPNHQLSCPAMWFKTELIKCYPDVADANPWVWVIKFERCEKPVEEE